MAAFLLDSLAALWGILLDSGVWLLAGLALAGVVHAFVPPGFLARHLASGGGSSVAPIVKASLLGVPLPLCSCSVIPVAAGLRRSGAGRGASAAFAISTPQTGEESVPLTWALFGPVFALARPVIAVVTAFIAGVLIERLTPERLTPERPAAGPHASPAPKPCCASAALTIGEDADPTTPSCCGGPAPTPAPEPAPGPCCAAPPPPSCGSDEPACCSGGGGSAPAEAPPGVAGRVCGALRHGFGTMLLDLAPWLAVGLVLSALVAAAVPEGWIAEHVGTGLAPMLLMLVVGTPLYVCATSSTPLAFALVGAGLSPGAALVLLLAGPATNAATMSWVVKDLGVRALAVYIGVIAAVAVGAGLAFDALLGGTIRLADHAHDHAHGVAGGLQWAGAAVFSVLLVGAVAVRLARLARPGIAPAAARA
jgi:uncharacterized membrane protein YraQ (UPF0718 family)